MWLFVEISHPTRKKFRFFIPGISPEFSLRIFRDFQIPIRIPGISGFSDLAQNLKVPHRDSESLKYPIPKPTVVLGPVLKFDRYLLTRRVDVQPIRLIKKLWCNENFSYIHNNSSFDLLFIVLPLRPKIFNINRYTIQCPFRATQILAVEFSIALNW